MVRDSAAWTQTLRDCHWRRVQGWLLGAGASFLILAHLGRMFTHWSAAYHAAYLIALGLNVGAFILLGVAKLLRW